LKEGVDYFSNFSLISVILFSNQDHVVEIYLLQKLKWGNYSRNIVVGLTTLGNKRANLSFSEVLFWTFNTSHSLVMAIDLSKKISISQVSVQ
jgi:hypothetical protein